MYIKEKEHGTSRDFQVICHDHNKVHVETWRNSQRRGRESMLFMTSSDLRPFPPSVLCPLMFSCLSVHRIHHLHARSLSGTPSPYSLADTSNSTYLKTESSSLKVQLIFLFSRSEVQAENLKVISLFLFPQSECRILLFF